MLNVTRAAYYKAIKREASQTVTEQTRIVTEIKRIHSQPRLDDYGSPRVHRELKSQGIECSKNTVAKLMRREGIRARTKPRFRVTTTDSKHSLPIAPNRLNHNMGGHSFFLGGSS